MATGTTRDTRESLLASLLSDEAFRPGGTAQPGRSRPARLVRRGADLQVPDLVGTASGRTIADHLCLPFGILETIFHDLRTRQVLVHTGSAALNDYNYTLTEQGRVRAQTYLDACAYVGPAPVPLGDYVLGRGPDDPGRSPKRSQLTEAFADISVDPELFESLGPAINSGAGPVPLRRRRATASRRSPSGSRCASARRSGFRTP